MTVKSELLYQPGAPKRWTDVAPMTARTKLLRFLRRILEDESNRFTVTTHLRARLHDPETLKDEEVINVPPLSPMGADGLAVRSFEKDTAGTTRAALVKEILELMAKDPVHKVKRPQLSNEENVGEDTKHRACQTILTFCSWTKLCAPPTCLRMLCSPHEASPQCVFSPQPAFGMHMRLPMRLRNTSSLPSMPLRRPMRHRPNKCVCTCKCIFA